MRWSNRLSIRSACRNPREARIWLALCASVVLLAAGCHGRGDLPERATSVDEDVSGGVNSVFIVDVSKSVLMNEVFAGMKERVSDYIEGIRLGDHVAILSFGEDVDVRFNEDIDHVLDKERALAIVDELEASSEWTYMGLALRTAADLARGLQSESPRDQHRIYLLTDGLNDPPPGVIDSGEYVDFSELLLEYFDFLAADDTFVYVLALHEPSDDLQGFVNDLERGGGNVNVRVDDSGPGLIPEPRTVVRVGSRSLDFGSIAVTDHSGTGMADLNIRQVVGEGGIAKLRLSLVLDPPLTLTAGLDPVEIERRSHAKVWLTLSLSGVPHREDYGRHSGFVRIESFDSNATVEPSEIPVVFEVVEPGVRAWQILLALLVAGAVTFFMVRQIVIRARARDVWIVKEDGQPPLHGVVRQRGLWLGAKGDAKCLDLGLPDFYLALGKGDGLRLCDERSGSSAELSFGERVELRGADDVTTTLRFFGGAEQAEAVAKRPERDDPVEDQLPHGWSH